MHDGTPYEITYGSGSISGVVSKDNVKLGDVSATTFGFGEVDTVKGVAFYASQMSGILGLAYDSISIDNLPTFIDVSPLADKSFAFQFKNLPEQSYLTIPGYDEAAKVEDFVFHNVIEQKYWSLRFDSMQQKGKPVIDMTGYKAVMDTGTSIIEGPKDLVDKLMEGIVVHRMCRDIELLPDITITIGGIAYILTYMDYVLQVDAGDGVMECISGIAGQVFPPTFKYMIFGDSFMRKYYTYFDKNLNRVGIALAAL